ncbi:hypothetical protein HYPSUDRAFT_200946 [Hypholoma sublateritium FD-334 SS-4]|uniref:Uncharacterized protein n=1 Tax=Hypholoma sublateritium (strain FD-334 SS-4) TaxID=945553 RepID=A0A0D2MKC3_HYPSF|nr:hypothetical protein HYPSUDRAFT_208696 [Hypholoma sublateritium FD-334 SS-4]KJA24143.1 hypothetical protein HYPSUDRAFT_200946 [Hypholoma sublateritium FD-334 SS-4]
MSSPPRSFADRAGSTSSHTHDAVRSQRVLQDVANNLAQSLFSGRKRSRPAFHQADDSGSTVGPIDAAPSTSSYYGAMVVAGIRHETADSDDEAVDDIPTIRAIQCWGTLCSIIPDFREQMLQLSADPKTRKAISAGAAAARCDDTAGLKSCIIDYVLADTTASRQLDLERKGKKVDRGFNHPVTAALLCPIKYMATEETFDQLKTGVLPCGASLLPRFLFPEKQVYNSEDVEDGCFRGHLLLRVAKHVLQGPSAALQAPGFHRVQASTHFALTSAANWDRLFGTFDYNEFYWNLLEFLQGPEGEDIIKLFDYHVFGQPVASKNPSITEKEESDYDIIKLQRAAKRARVAAADTSAAAPSSSITTTNDQSPVTTTPPGANRRDLPGSTGDSAGLQA